MNPTQATQDPSTRSPLAGCAILITAVLVMVFLIGFSTLTLFRQFNEIAKFTAEKPIKIQISTLEDREAELNALSERLEAFRQQLQDDAPCSLALSPEDLNLAIAAFDSFKELRGTFRIIGSASGRFKIAISFPLNGRPRLSRDDEPGWITSDSRFLNATLTARPELHSKEIVIAIDAIDVPGAQVPSEFIGQMSPYRIAERYITDPILGPAMARVTRVAVTDGNLVFSRTPGETAVGTITDQQVDSASGRLFKTFGIAAAAFLSFAGIIVFIGIRTKSRKSQIP
jgi:hypothetical protein